MARAKAKLEWLEEARAALNDDPDFRKLGSTDLILGLEIGDAARLVVFEAFEISAVREIAPVDLRDADIVISMAPRDWNAYLRQRQKGKGPSLLSLDLDSGVVRGADPLARLKLSRYNQSIQLLLDTGARLAA